MAGDHDQGLIQVTIDGVTLSDLAEFTEPEIEGSELSTIMAGGARGIGQNFSSLANSGEIPLRIAYPSGDSEFLIKLAASKRKVDFVYRYTDASELPDGELITFSCRGRLHKGSHTKGKEADPREFTFRFVGYTMEFKNKSPLTRE